MINALEIQEQGWQSILNQFKIIQKETLSGFLFIKLIFYFCSSIINPLKDYYYFLGIKPNASSEDIKKRIVNFR